VCDVVLQSLCQDFDKLSLCKEEPDDPVLFCLCSASLAEHKYVLIVKIIEWQSVTIQLTNREKSTFSPGLYVML